MMEDASWEEVEKEITLIECLFRRLPEEERLNAACRIASAVPVWSGGTFYEQLGILEEAKNVFRENWMDVMDEESEDEE